MKLFSKFPLVLILRIAALCIFVGALIGGVFWESPAETFVTWAVALVIGLLLVGIAELLEITNKSASKGGSAQADNPYDELERLSSLRQQGVITDQEYEAKKKELLSRI